MSEARRVSISDDSKPSTTTTYSILALTDAVNSLVAELKKEALKPQILTDALKELDILQITLEALRSLPDHKVTIEKAVPPFSIKSTYSNSDLKNLRDWALQTNKTVLEGSLLQESAKAERKVGEESTARETRLAAERKAQEEAEKEKMRASHQRREEELARLQKAVEIAELKDKEAQLAASRTKHTQERIKTIPEETKGSEYIKALTVKMLDTYDNDLHQKRHIGAMTKLVTVIDQCAPSPQHSTFQNQVEVLLTLYRHQKDTHDSKSSNPLSRARASVLKFHKIQKNFAHELNTNPGNSHYSRMLAVALHNIAENYGDALGEKKQKEILDLVKDVKDIYNGFNLSREFKPDN